MDDDYLVAFVTYYQGVNLLLVEFPGQRAARSGGSMTSTRPLGYVLLEDAASTSFISTTTSSLSAATLPTSTTTSTSPTASTKTSEYITFNDAFS
jgi:hypothetical protein